MSEKALATMVMKILKPLHGVRIENLCAKGTLDINYVGGWIELKQQDAWPKRATTVVRLDHDLTIEQRLWIHMREAKGGVTYVLLQVEREYLLFKGGIAAVVIGAYTQAGLYRAAIHVWTAAEMKEELVKCLQQEV